VGGAYSLNIMLKRRHHVLESAPHFRRAPSIKLQWDGLSRRALIGSRTDWLIFFNSFFVNYCEDRKTVEGLSS